MGLWEIRQGDALTVLRQMPVDSVHCCATSPPYFGLRDYGVPGQIGLEPTPAAFVARLVEVFAEVRRVLRPDGTCWINLGDSYAGGAGGRGDVGNFIKGVSTRIRPVGEGRIPRGIGPGLKPKDLVGAPWRVAFALQEAGWWLRSEIIWHKPSPMPESVTDRPTRAHEQVFLLTKSARYFYDAEAVREPMAEASASRYAYAFGGPRSEALAAADRDGMGVRTRPIGIRTPGDGRNLRSVWSVPSEAFPGSHFATFPTALVEPMILAGTSAKGCCPACGAPWLRVVERERKATRPGENTKVASVLKTPAEEPGRSRGPARFERSTLGQVIGNRDPQRHCTATRSVGWRQGCKCPEADPVPCTVLDPFCGSGTTLKVAVGLGRRGLGIELSPAYCEMARRRLTDDAPLFAALPEPEPPPEPTLFDLEATP